MKHVQYCSMMHANYCCLRSPLTSLAGEVPRYGDLDMFYGEPQSPFILVRIVADASFCVAFQTCMFYAGNLGSEFPYFSLVTCSTTIAPVRLLVLRNQISLCNASLSLHSCPREAMPYESQVKTMGSSIDTGLFATIFQVHKRTLTWTDM